MLRVASPYLEHVAERAHAGLRMRFPLIAHEPGLIGRTQSYARRQRVLRQRVVGGDLAARALDPPAVRMHERGDIAGARATRHDELERIRRQDPQGEPPGAATLANTQRHRRRIRPGAAPAVPGTLAIPGGRRLQPSRIEETQLFRHASLDVPTRRLSNLSTGRNATVATTARETRGAVSS